MLSFTDTDFTAVESSTIRAVAYDPESSVLAIRFNSGGEYRYEGVPREEVAILLDRNRNGGSIGKRFQAVIRPNYACKKVNPSTGAAEPIRARLASDKQIDFIRRLAGKAEIYSGAKDERIGAMWAPVATAGGERVVNLARHNPLVESFLAALTSDEAGLVITYLKERTA